MASQSKLSSEQADEVLAKYAPNWRENLNDPVVMGRALLAIYGRGQQAEIMQRVNIDKASADLRLARWPMRRGIRGRG